MLPAKTLNLKRATHHTNDLFDKIPTKKPPTAATHNSSPPKPLTGAGFQQTMNIEQQSGDIKLLGTPG